MNDTELEEYRRYCANVFSLPAERLSFPWADEAFAASWEGYASEAKEHGAWNVLRGKFPQLRFQISAGVSESEAYRAATRRGLPHDGDAGLELERPEDFSFSLHPTPAGRIPVLISRHRPDFVSLVRALAHRSEPVLIPDSQGACMVAGFNNWDRIHRLKLEFAGRSEEEWRTEFTMNIKPQTDLYQDRFIILSDGPYSGVPATDLGMPEKAWRETSLIIRREHECAHYFTKRVLGSMRNHVLDEILADTAGILAAVGGFRADWFLRFFGLENFPNYRPGARLENYRATLPPSEEIFTLLTNAVQGAARAIESAKFSPADHVAAMLAIATSNLQELGGENGASILRTSLEFAREILGNSVSADA